MNQLVRQATHLCMAIVTCGLFLFGTAAESSLLSQDSKKQNQAESASIAEVTQKYLRLDFDGKSLQHSFPSLADSPKLKSDFRKTRNINYSGSSESGSNWSIRLRGKKLMLEIGSGTRRNRNIGFGGDNGGFLMFEDFKLPLHWIDLEVTDKRTVRGFVFGGFDGELLRFHQLENGEISAQYIPPLKSLELEPFAVGANSMRALWNKYGAIVDERLLPAMKKLGVAVPPSRFDPEIIRQLRSSYEVSDERWISFLEIAKGFDSPEYQIREATVKRIESEFDSWSAQVRRGIETSTLSVQARTGLSKIMKSKGSRNSKQVTEIISSLDLANDPEVLVRVMEGSPKNTSLAIAKRLEEVTGQSFGNNVSAWKEFVSKTRSANNGSEVAQRTSNSDNDWPLPEIAEENQLDIFQHSAEELSRLVRLTVSEQGHLMLDRKAWQEDFGGKSIKQLSKEMGDELAERNLPNSWLKNSEAIAKDLYGLEHVLVESLNDHLAKLPTKAKYFGEGFLPPVNRFFRGERYDLILRRTSQEEDSFSSTGKKPEFFILQLKQLSGPQNELWLIEEESKNPSKPHGFRFTLYLAQTATLIDLVQGSDGQCRLVFMKNSEVHQARSTSFKELWESQKTFIASKILPEFEKFGIDVSKELGGPLEHHSLPVSKK